MRIIAMRRAPVTDDGSVCVAENYIGLFHTPNFIANLIKCFEKY